MGVPAVARFHRSRGQPGAVVQADGLVLDRAAAAHVADVVMPTHTDEAPVFGDKDREATARRYLDMGVEEVVVKDGANPALVATQDGGRYEVAATVAEKVVDATGAGDSFNGGYLTARLAGQSPEAAAKRGHAVAGIVIGHKGALVDPALVQS